jgi:nitrite reductase/ring-hydroxylating ferredoxin subunit
VDLRFTIYPNSTTYLNLNYYGGYEYFTGGVAGVIVYRLDETTFFAYDRACPYDWEDPDSWLWVDESGILIVDYCCGAKFNILDGTPVSGPTSLPLKHYKCRYDGASLLVYN